MPNGNNFLQTLIALNAMGRAPITTAPIQSDGRGGAVVLPTLPAPSPIAAPITTAPPTLAPPLLLPQRPEPPPIAPAQPVDMAIIQRFLQLAGTEPTAPVIRPASTVDKIAAGLQGFGAGVQGQGPQFVAGLREQRERPQREFEERQRQFEERRQQLGLIGTQAAQREAESRRERIQATADQQFERELQENARRLRLEEGREQEEFRDLLLRRRQREDDRRATVEAERREQARREDNALKVERDFVASGAPGGVARNLARFYSGQTAERSQVAARWEERAAQVELQRKQAGRRGGGGGGGAATHRSIPINRINPNTELGRAAAIARINEFEQAKAELGAALGGGTEARQRFARRSLEGIIRQLRSRPDAFEIGVSGPDIDTAFVKLVQPGGNVGFPLQPQAGAQPQAQSISLDDVQEFAQINGISEAEARRRLTAAGAAVR